MRNIESYIAVLVQNISEKISAKLNMPLSEEIISRNLKYHFIDQKSKNFQRYYFETVSNENFFLNSVDFFRQFKYQYSLQGIDGQYLNRLESNKPELLKLIHNDEIATLYFGHFSKVRLKHGERYVEKDLGSFFAKFVHTFRPADYCALDNPIKNYFGLGKESFFVAFLTISKAYVNWAHQHREIITEIRQKLEKIDKDKLINSEKLTDLKLLDLIFWTESNVNKAK